MQPEDVSETQPPFIEPPLFTPVIAEQERDPFWGYADLFLLIGLLVASFALILTGVGVWLHFHPALRDDVVAISLPVQFVLYIFVYLCFFLIFKFKYGRGVFESLKWRKTRYSLLTAGFGGVILAFALSAIAQLIHTPKVETPFEQLVKTPLSILFLAFTAVVLAPLFEEMVFRGFIQPLLSRSLGVVFGVLVTSCLFGGLHAPEYQDAWQYIVGITLVGVALGAVRAKTDSIIPGTVMHGCFNAVSVVGLIAAKYFPHK